MFRTFNVEQLMIRHREVFSEIDVTNGNKPYLYRKSLNKHQNKAEKVEKLFDEILEETKGMDNVELILQIIQTKLENY